MEKFRTISVAVTEDVDSLDKALVNYFNESDGVSISKFPDVLLIDLKRFYYDVEKQSVQKVLLT